MNEAKNVFTAEEDIDFDNEISSFHTHINSEMVDWKAASIQECFSEYVNKKNKESSLTVKMIKNLITLKMNNSPSK